MYKVMNLSKSGWIAEYKINKVIYQCTVRSKLRESSSYIAETDRKKTKGIQGHGSGLLSTCLMNIKHEETTVSFRFEQMLTSQLR